MYWYLEGVISRVAISANDMPLMDLNFRMCSKILS